MLGLAWTQARNPCRLLLLPLRGPPLNAGPADSSGPSSITLRPQITAVYFYGALYTDAHLTSESHNMRTLLFFVWHRKGKKYTQHTHIHSPVAWSCVCSVSVYKYDSETAVMAPASNKQRKEKPPIPASNWPKSQLDRHPTSSRWTFSRRASAMQPDPCACGDVPAEQSGGSGFWFVPHVAFAVPRHNNSSALGGVLWKKNKKGFLLVGREGYHGFDLVGVGRRGEIGHAFLRMEGGLYELLRVSIYWGGG